ncbi:MAG: hypothetical protein ABSE56_11245 [Bryobacteraceae bacterium]|jgi:uncharacterized protein (TIGR03437 family)
MTVRSEGLTEEMGDIVLLCAGGTPGATISEPLYVFLSVPITNRASSDGVVDVILTVDTGSGPPFSTGAVPTLTGTGIGFYGINVTVPLSGAVSFRITNLRGAVAQQGITNKTPITAFLGSGGVQLLFLQNSVTVGVPSRGLAADAATVGISACSGSPLPDNISMSSLIAAGTRSSTMRVIAGFPRAFEKRKPGTDSGVRFILRYSGFRPGARLIVPDVVAGSDATQPTSSGNLSLAASGGSYTPGGYGSLLLARVDRADANGAGGAPVYAPGAPGSGTVAFDSVTEVPLVSGAAQVVYEVVDANALTYVTESAEIPTFLGLAPTSDLGPLGDQSVTFGPVSTVARSTETDPVPRFVAALPPAGCTLLGDCASFPTLVVNAPPLVYTAEAGSRDQGTYFVVSNGGGGVLEWNVSVTYKTGANWIKVQTSPLGEVWVTVSPKNLAPGVYEGALTIDAGPYAGSQTLPVKLTVTVPVSTPQIDSIGHAATYASGPVAPGSLAMLKGVKLAGDAVAVSFDGLPAKLLYTSYTQINLLVPPELGSRATAQVFVTVDGLASAPFTVSLTPVNPGIFPSGILNQDLSVNSASNPAVIGSVIVVFATGLPTEAGAITAKIGDREITALDYAGPAPTLIGVEQVNIRVPADLAPMTADVVLCGLDLTTGRKVCSPPGTRVTLRQ